MNIKFLPRLLLLSAAFLVAQPAVAKWPHRTAQISEENGTQSSKAVVETVEAKVIAVHDGDTLRAVDSNGRQMKVRLAYIDAPEINQAFGIASRDELRREVLDQMVMLTLYGHDQYHRWVAKVQRQGRDINLSQIKTGDAWHYVSIAKLEQSFEDYTTYEQAQSVARQARKGLWQQRDPQAPWLFRKSERAEKQNANQIDGFSIN